MRTQLFLGSAAVVLLLTGAAAQTTRDEQPRAGSQSRSQEGVQHQPVERIQDMNRQKGNTAQSAQPAQNKAGQPAQNSAAQPSTSGQNQPQQPAQTGQAPQPNNAPNRATGTAQQSPSAPSTSAPSTQQQSAQPAPSQPRQTGQSQSSGQAQPSGQTQQPAQNGSSGAQRSSGVVSLNVQQQTRIGQTIARHNVKPLTNVNFSISVGTRVPRSVTLRALPADLVTFVPQYRGYSYFVVEEQIVIVEPSTLEIVSIVPYSSTSKTVRSERAPMTSRSVSLSTEQRDAIRKHATRKQTVTRESFGRTRYKAGDRVEKSVTIESFPETVYEEVPVVRRYRYFTDDDDVILVDPDEDRVVDVIR